MGSQQRKLEGLLLKPLLRATQFSGGLKFGIVQQKNRDEVPSLKKKVCFSLRCILPSDLEPKVWYFLMYSSVDALGLP